jgi:hypothetical protein
VREYGGVLFVHRGSVGKPKDGDPEIEVAIERVPYDAEAVAGELTAAGLPAEYAEKLVAAV